MLRRHFLVAILSLFIVAGCATNKPATAPAPQPPPEAVKSQEAPPLQRAQIKTDLAAGYYERGQFEVALEVLDEAQRLEPNYAKTYAIYGLVYTMLGETQKAETNFQRALALAPNDPEIRANWGGFLCTTGRTREAIPELDAAIRDPLFKTPEIALINARARRPTSISAARSRRRRATRSQRTTLRCLPTAKPGSTMRATGCGR
jgi:type IV pilus assembly protein PilF